MGQRAASGQSTATSGSRLSWALGNIGCWGGTPTAQGAETLAGYGEGRRPPTVVALGWDYCYASPIVDRSPGVDGVEFIEPADLGLPEDLAERLMSWFDRMPHWDRDEAADPEWHHEGLTLAYDLQHAVGPGITVLYGGRPISEHRGP